MRVLAVDDNEDAVRSLGKILELDGYDVRVAFGGKAAVSTAVNFKPDVILLDIAMPDVTGLDVAKLIHELPELGSILLIATTGYGDSATIRRLAEAGIEHVLLKPLDLSQLRTILQANAADVVAHEVPD